MPRRGDRQPEPEVRNSANPRANFASIKAFCQIARRAFSEEEVQTIASMLADTRGPAGQPQYDERDVRNSRNQPSRNQPERSRNQPERAERGGRSGGRNESRNEGGRGSGRAERGGRSNANEGGRGSGRAERGGRAEEGGRRRNNRRPTQ